ncbi:MAG: hypothetical protein EAZ42_00875 [Verrucomicrobia bacterium]|nr:MAG: hypothetical protein EAZ42_00875 [Verrucomicrobiota bacterium]
MPRPVETPPRRPPYFWWLLANGLALCFAVLSWVICLYVFSNPEVPRNYEILTRLKRIPELTRFDILTVPNGNVLTPKELYSKFFGTPKERIPNLNSLLLRNYLRNFENPLFITYIEGDYRISDVRKLSEKDFISSGVVVRAQAMIRPDEFTAPLPYPVIIDYVFPTHDAKAIETFSQGDILTVKKSPNCAAILHIDRVIHNEEPSLLLTVMPIAYGPYQAGKKTAFSIEPPEKVRPRAGFPIIR